MVPRFADCSFLGCTRPSVRGKTCASCERPMCAVHMLPGQHACPFTSQVEFTTPEQEFDSEVGALLARINVDELCRVASSLRNGEPCRFSAGISGGRKSAMNGIYFDAWIDFEESGTWAVRIPRITAFSHLPKDLMDSFVQNEYSTLNWLKGTQIPTLQAHGYGLASDPSNLVGVGYLFTHVPPGEPFNVLKATRVQKSKVYRQYAKILGKIGRQYHHHACSLTHADSRYIDDAIASDWFTHLGRHGPFGTPLEYFASTAEQHLDLIADGQLYPEYPKEAFVFYRMLRDEIAPELARRSGDDSKFWLKHMNDTGDHIRVDDNYEIKAIVNWQFARFVPAEEAFSLSLFTASIGRLYGGAPGLSKNDRLLIKMLRGSRKSRKAKKAKKSTQFASSDDLARRFQLGLASGLSKTEVLELIRGMLVFLPSETVPIRYRGVEAWCEEQWNNMAGDPRKQKIEELLEAMPAEEA